MGIEASLCALSLGAEVIEKHFTSNNNFSKFRDHKLSSNPTEMGPLVKQSVETKYKKREFVIKNIY